MTLSQAEYLGIKIAFWWASIRWFSGRGPLTATRIFGDYGEERWPWGPHVSKVGGEP